MTLIIMYHPYNLPDTSTYPLVLPALTSSLCLSTQLMLNP